MVGLAYIGVSQMDGIGILHVLKNSMGVKVSV